MSGRGLLLTNEAHDILKPFSSSSDLLVSQSFFIYLRDLGTGVLYRCVLYANYSVQRTPPSSLVACWALMADEEASRAPDPTCWWGRMAIVLLP